MKRQSILLLLPIFIFISCQKEDSPPAELIGKWEDRFLYLEKYTDTGVITRLDTISIVPRNTFNFYENFIVKTNRYFPECDGNFALIRHKKFIELYFPCQVNEDVNNGKILSKIHRLTNDTLVLEFTFENGFSRTTLIKIE